MYFVLGPLFATFTTFYHLSCLSNIFSCEHRKRFRINRGCSSHREENLLQDNFYVRQSVNWIISKNLKFFSESNCMKYYLVSYVIID